MLYYRKLGSSISTVTFVSALTKVSLLAGYLLLNEPTIDGILIILIASVAIKALITIFFVRMNYELLFKEKY